MGLYSGIILGTEQKDSSSNFAVSEKRSRGLGYRQTMRR